MSVHMKVDKTFSQTIWSVISYFGEQNKVDIRDKLTQAVVGKSVWVKVIKINTVNSPYAVCRRS